MSEIISWIKAGPPKERVVGSGSLEFTDVANRPLRQVLSASGADPDLPFVGFLRANSTASEAVSASHAEVADVALSGTGSFTGSFTGSLLGSASNATSASWAATASAAAPRFIIGTDPGGIATAALRVGGTFYLDGSGSAEEWRIRRRGRLLSDGAESAGYWLGDVNNNAIAFTGLQSAPSQSEWGVWHNSAWRLSINTDGRVLVNTGPLVVGTDPGGSELLRVGGQIVSRGAGTSGAVRVENASLDGFKLGQTAVKSWGLDQLSAGHTFHISANGVVIGTDPGGNNNLRVSGSAKFTGPVTASAFTGSAYQATSDTGGSPNSMTFVAGSPGVALSTGTGSIFMTGSVNQANTGWLKMYSGSTTIWLPYWENIG